MQHNALQCWRLTKLPGRQVVVRAFAVLTCIIFNLTADLDLHRYARVLLPYFPPMCIHVAADSPAIWLANHHQETEPVPVSNRHKNPGSESHWKPRIRAVISLSPFIGTTGNGIRLYGPFIAVTFVQSWSAFESTRTPGTPLGACHLVGEVAGSIAVPPEACQGCRSFRQCTRVHGGWLLVIVIVQTVCNSPGAVHTQAL